jgi:protein O-GlcNAc transferase
VVITSRAEDAYRLGLDLHKVGRLVEACALYHEVLKLRPDHGQALHQLGVIALQTNHPDIAVDLIARSIRINSLSVAAHTNHGRAQHQLCRYEAALASFDRAVALKPDYAVGHNDRGIALAALGRHRDALASYERAIALQPDLADAHSNRGIVLAALKSYEAAVASYEEAIRLNSRHAMAYNNRGIALGALGRHEESLASYDSALALEADYINAHTNRSVALRELERFEEAVASCDRAIAISPDSADAHCNRAAALRELKRFEEALENLDNAVALDGRHSRALNNRGIVLTELRRYPEALASYDRALEVTPHSAEIRNNRGYLLGELRRYDEALAAFDQAIALEPGNADAHVNRGVLLTFIKHYEPGLESLDRALALKPDVPFLRGLRLHNRLHLCDWRDFNEESAAIAAGVEQGRRMSNPMSFLAISGLPALQRRVADIWVPYEYPPRSAAIGIQRRCRPAKIRVGIFSGDFRLHAVSILAARLFELHDRSGFEWTAFSFGPDTRDSMRLRMERAFDRFIDVTGRSDEQVVELARELQIDVAVDLSGYTQHCRLGIFARRVAPVQAGWLGYPGTVGGQILDYLIADSTVVPPESQAHYSERIVYLPHSYLPSDSQRPIAARAFTREELGLPSTGFVYCCFNNNYKITPETFDSWMRILGQVPHGVLWLSETNAKAAENLRREARARGVDDGRLIFAPRLPSLEEHLARHRAADLFLDTLPYNAHTTASDALWAGLPVLTCAGQAFAGRVGASLLNAIELPELITTDRACYEATAVELASSPERLRDIRDKLARHRLTTPLFDTTRMARHLESAFRAVHERYLADLAPDHIHVPEPSMATLP